MRELEEQEAQITESDELSSHSVQQHHSSDDGAIVTTASNNLTTDQSSSSMLLDAAVDDMARRIDYQSRLLEGATANNILPMFDYVRAVEQRKREIAARIGGGGVRPAMSSSTSDSGLVLPSNSSSAAPVSVVADKQTVYSSDSGIGSGQSNQLNSGQVESSLFKKPINLAVEQLNSEIQGLFDLLS